MMPRWLIALGVSLCLLSAAHAAATQALSQTQTHDSLSNHGRYRITLVLPKPLDTLGQAVATELRILDAQGQATRPHRISLDGGMREHQHGLPSTPSVTRYLGDGRWQVSGLMFSMRGQWQLTVQVMDDQGWDWGNFEFDVGSLPKKDATFDAHTVKLLETLSVQSLGKVEDPSNPVLHNTLAAEIGHELFFDSWLSRSEQMSCASCHVPKRAFSDGRLVGQGEQSLNINVPTLIGVAHQRWLYHDGRRDSLWAQALTPLEAAEEMNISRAEVLHYFFSVPQYKAAYETLFGPAPTLSGLPKVASPVRSKAEQAAWQQLRVPERRRYNHAFANIGRLLAAYQSRLLPQPTRFDHYVAQLAESQKQASTSHTDQHTHHAEHSDHHGDGSVSQSQATPILNEQEQQGLRLFLSPQTRCLDCHSGPLFSNGQFHNIGTRRAQDLGRQAGVQAVLYDAFNCLGRYSGVERSSCQKLRYIERLGSDFHSAGAFRVPTLRNLGHTAPYMHHGQLAELDDVMEHYNQPPEQAQQPNNELLPMALDSDDKAALIAFLRTLDTDDATLTQSPWFQPPSRQR